MSDQYYSGNTGNKLFMGRATSTPLPAPGLDVFDEVPLLVSVKPPANELSVGRFSVQNDANRRSIGGKLGDRSTPGVLVADWSETIHRTMEADSILPGGRKRNWYIIHADSGARREDYVGFINKFEQEEFSASEDAKEHLVNFEISVDGAVAVTY